MPGGSIDRLERPARSACGSESELAGALAHEIAHVVMSHQLAAIQSSMQRGNLASRIGTDLASDQDRRARRRRRRRRWPSRTSLDAARRVIKDGFFLRPLDRAWSTKPTSMAIVLATRSGYDPYGLVGVLQMLAHVQGRRRRGFGLQHASRRRRTASRSSSSSCRRVEQLCAAAAAARGPVQAER